MSAIPEHDRCSRVPQALVPVVLSVVHSVGLVSFNTKKVGRGPPPPRHYS